MHIVIILSILVVFCILWGKKQTKIKHNELLKAFEEHIQKLSSELPKFNCTPCLKCKGTTFTIVKITPSGRFINVQCDCCEEKTRFGSLPKTDLTRIVAWWESTLKQQKDLDKLAVTENHSVSFSLNPEQPDLGNPSVSKQTIPKFEVYYPTESDLGSEQFVFFQKLERDLDQGIYYDVDNNVGYLYVYLHKLLSSWDQIGFDALRETLIDISKLYRKEEAFSNHCFNMSFD